MLFLEVDDNDARASTTTSGAAAAAAESGSEEATTQAEVKWRTGPKGRASEKGPPVGTCGSVPWFCRQNARGQNHGWRRCPYGSFNGRDYFRIRLSFVFQFAWHNSLILTIPVRVCVVLVCTWAYHTEGKLFLG
jgi:hypothetical protein